MDERLTNPFEITKAVDFTDQEILSYWIDFAGGSGFYHMMNPESPVPMFILGGKGSGKTHLLRYFSFGLQQIRHSADLLTGLQSEGYVGVYLLSSSLNASRFRGKKLTSDQWSGLFCYYMDLWLSQLLIDSVSQIYSGSVNQIANESQIASRIGKLIGSSHNITSFSDVSTLFINERRAIDEQVNNLPFTNNVHVDIRSSPGDLVLRIPRILSDNIPSFRKISIVYLIDEIENLESYQQEYLNTLVRERQRPSTFRIGARLYGVKTFATTNDSEENKEGSEFDILRLDHRLREDEHSYATFAKKLFARRLREAGYLPGAIERHVASDQIDLSAFIESQPSDKLAEAQTAFVIENYKSSERPYFKLLCGKLSDHANRPGSRVLFDAGEIDRICAHLRFEQYPLLEKVNIFLLYRAWSKSKRLLEESARIAEDAVAYVESDFSGGDHGVVLEKFKGDLLAQLYRDCNKPQQYVGFDTLVTMSHGLPRNLLVLLKYSFNWAVFFGERPFNRPISLAAQQKAVLEASEWFYRDARMTGSDGVVVHAAIGRLAELFKAIRYSDKPSECSLVSFSADLSKVSETSRRIIDLAEKWSFLVSIQGGQHDRNSMRVDAKFQLNRMLAPRWDLPIHRRGVLQLSTSDVNAIFDPDYSTYYKNVVEDKISRMNAPFISGGNQSTPGQLSIPGLVDND